VNLNIVCPRNGIPTRCFNHPFLILASPTVDQIINKCILIVEMGNEKFPHFHKDFSKLLCLLNVSCSNTLYACWGKEPRVWYCQICSTEKVFDAALCWCTFFVTKKLPNSKNIYFQFQTNVNLDVFVVGKMFFFKLLKNQKKKNCRQRQDSNLCSQREVDF
jgi:hypothetical protein